jgi:hypothetical protein
MAEQRERKPGTGVAFINENKKEDWHADFTGEFADFDGNLYYLNVTKKLSGHSGIEYISVSLGKPKGNKAAAPAPKAPAQTSDVNFDDLPDDLPF